MSKSARESRPAPEEHGIYLPLSQDWPRLPHARDWRLTCTKTAARSGVITACCRLSCIHVYEDAKLAGET